jgi:hypothetical protein
VWGLLPLPLITKVPFKIGVFEPQGLVVRNCVKFLMVNVKLSLKQNLIMYFAGIDYNITFFQL